MTNADVAAALRMISLILEIHEENPFKVRAYMTASRAVEGLSEDVAALARDGRLEEVFGIGESLRDKIAELVTTGKMAYLEELKDSLPEGVLEILQIPSVGPKKAKTIWKRLGITSVERLREACLKGELRGAPRFGEKTEAKILEGIDFKRRHRGEFLLHEALPVARRLLAHLEASKDVLRTGLAGSLRRGKELVHDIDLLASSDRPEAAMERFVGAPGVAEILVRGGTKASVRTDAGIQVDLRVVSDAQFATALAYFTGSKEHNIAVRKIAQRKGLKVSEYGIFRGSRARPCRDEREFYAALGLPYVPPELRENAGELEQRMPALLERRAVRGALHAHSTWSDGTARIAEMAERARALGYAWLGLSDHSKSAAYAGGLDEKRLRKQAEEIDRLNRGWSDFRILKGVECDILPDGSLDLDPRALASLDFVIGSVHSGFTMSKERMTGRVVRALEDPNLDVLGHPTGRVLLARDGYAVDLERVLEAARRHGKAVELNASPQRLDLDAAACRRAKELGVRISIGPDAHSTAALENLEYGVLTARRGWLGDGDVLNTLDAEALLRRFRAA